MARPHGLMETKRPLGRNRRSLSLMFLLFCVVIVLVSFRQSRNKNVEGMLFQKYYAFNRSPISLDDRNQPQEDPIKLSQFQGSQYSDDKIRGTVTSIQAKQTEGKPELNDAVRNTVEGSKQYISLDNTRDNEQNNTQTFVSAQTSDHELPSEHGTQVYSVDDRQQEGMGEQAQTNEPLQQFSQQYNLTEKSNDVNYSNLDNEQVNADQADYKTTDIGTPVQVMFDIPKPGSLTPNNDDCCWQDQQGTLGDTSDLGKKWMPNVLIVGAQKSATSYVSAYLKEQGAFHFQYCRSQKNQGQVKEPHFWNQLEMSSEHVQQYAMSWLPPNGITKYQCSDDCDIIGDKEWDEVLLKGGSSSDASGKNSSKSDEKAADSINSDETGGAGSDISSDSEQTGSSVDTNSSTSNTNGDPGDKGQESELSQPSQSSSTAQQTSSATNAQEGGNSGDSGTSGSLSGTNEEVVQDDGLAVNDTAQDQAGDEPSNDPDVTLTGYDQSAILPDNNSAGENDGESGSNDADSSGTIEGTGSDTGMPGGKQEDISDQNDMSGIMKQQLAQQGFGQLETGQQSTGQQSTGQQGKVQQSTVLDGEVQGEMAGEGDVARQLQERQGSLAPTLITIQSVRTLLRTGNTGFGNKGDSSGSDGKSVVTTEQGEVGGQGADGSDSQVVSKSSGGEGGSGTDVQGGEGSGGEHKSGQQQQEAFEAPSLVDDKIQSGADEYGQGESHNDEHQQQLNNSTTTTNADGAARGSVGKSDGSENAPDDEYSAYGAAMQNLANSPTAAQATADIPADEYMQQQLSQAYNESSDDTTPMSCADSCSNRHPLGGVRLDATPDYLPRPYVACRVKAFAPDTKIIMLLRDPASRAISQYRMNYRQRATKPELLSTIVNDEVASLTDRGCTFDPSKGGGVKSWKDCYGCYETSYGQFCWQHLAGNQSFEDSEKRAGLLGRGIYGPQVAWWLQYFTPDQLLIVNFDQVANDELTVLNNIAQFAGVEHATFNENMKMLPNGKTKVSFAPFKYIRDIPPEVDADIKETIPIVERFFTPLNVQLYQLLETVGIDFAPFEAVYDSRDDEISQ